MSVLDLISNNGAHILLYGSVIVPLVLIGCLMLIGQRPNSPG